jgi:hypothetical protein
MATTVYHRVAWIASSGSRKKVPGSQASVE